MYTIQIKKIMRGLVECEFPLKNEQRLKEQAKFLQLFYAEFKDLSIRNHMQMFYHKDGYYVIKVFNIFIVVSPLRNNYTQVNLLSNDNVVCAYQYENGEERNTLANLIEFLSSEVSEQCYQTAPTKRLEMKFSHPATFAILAHKQKLQTNKFRKKVEGNTFFNKIKELIAITGVYPQFDYISENSGYLTIGYHTLYITNSSNNCLEIETGITKKKILLDLDARKNDNLILLFSLYINQVAFCSPMLQDDVRQATKQIFNTPILFDNFVTQLSNAEKHSQI